MFNFRRYEPNTSADDHDVRAARLPGGQILRGGARHRGALPLDCGQFRRASAKPVWREYLALHIAVRAGARGRVQPDDLARRGAGRQRGRRRAV